MDSQLRQQLLELVYDLLPASEAAELRERVRTDPAVAAAYAEAQETALLLAEAARLPALAVPVAASGKPPAPAAGPREPASAQPISKRKRVRQPLSRAANWTVGIAAALLVLVSVGGYLYHRGQLAAIAAGHLRLFVAGPSTLSRGAAGQYTIHTTAIGGQPLPAQVEVALLAADGRRLKSYKETADEQGRLLISIPTDLRLPDQTRLQVVAWHGPSQAGAETTLEVEPEQYQTHVAVDREAYRPGERVQFRSVTLSRFGLEADRRLAVQCEMLDPAWAAVPGTRIVTLGEHGVAWGTMTIPGNAAGGRYSIVAAPITGHASAPASGQTGISGPLSRASRTFAVLDGRAARLDEELEFTRNRYGPGQTVVAHFKAQRAEGGAAAQAPLHVTASLDGRVIYRDNARTGEAGTSLIEFRLPEKIDPGDGHVTVAMTDHGVREVLTRPIPIELGKIEVEFYPEGGHLVAGLENRVYFAGRSPLGKPVGFSGSIVAVPPENGKRDSVGDARGRTVASIETLHEGMGVFHFVPRIGETYRLKIARPEGIEAQAALPEVSADHEVVLAAGPGVFAADQPLKFVIQSTRSGLPLVVAAYCRGVEVGQQTLVTQTGEGNSVTLPIEERAGGTLRLAAYDYRSSPPKLVAQRLVYRRPARSLNIQVALPEGRYTAGGKVDLALRVTDETGQPAAATLGMSLDNASQAPGRPASAAGPPAGGGAPSMPADFLLAGELCQTEELQNADSYLLRGGEAVRNRPVGTPPEVALDLLLGTQGCPHLGEVAVGAEQAGRDVGGVRLASLGVGGPPFVYDNSAEIQATYEKSLADYQAGRTAILKTLTVASLLAGLGLVLFVAMLSIMRIITRLRLWLPALGAAACSLVLGAILMEPSRPEFGRGAAVAFASYPTHWSTPKMPDRRAEAREMLLASKAAPSAAAEVAADRAVAARVESKKTVARGGANSSAAPTAKGSDGANAAKAASGEGKRARSAAEAGAEAAPAFAAPGAPSGGASPTGPAGPPFGSASLPAPSRKAGKSGGESAAKRDSTRHGSAKSAKKSGGLGGMAQEKAKTPGDVPAARGGQAVERQGEADTGRNDKDYFGTDDESGAQSGPAEPGRQVVAHQQAAPAAQKSPPREGDVDAFDQTDYRGAFRRVPGGRAGGSSALWQPLLETGADGKASVRFELPDASSTFRVAVHAHGGGRLGFAEAEIVAPRPFVVASAMPPQANCGDQIDITVAVANNTAGPMAVRLDLDHGVLVSSAGPLNRSLRVAPGGSSPESFSLQATGESGQCEVALSGVAAGQRQTVRRELQIVPPGFPRSVSYSGQIDGRQDIAVRLPGRWAKGSLRVALVAFPSVLADLAEAREAVRQGPGGCFQQAAALSAIDALSMQYILDQKLADPEVTRLIRTSLDGDMAGLAGYECKGGGFAPLHDGPADEALTALALLQFRWMERVYGVDGAMVRRTADWLRGRAENSGREASMLALLALAEPGEPGGRDRIDRAIELGARSDDPRMAALAAAVAIQAGQAEYGAKLLRKLSAKQASDGHVELAPGSAGHAGPLSPRMEATAVAALVWLQSPESVRDADKAVAWILAHRQADGSFGPPRATALALMAIVQHAGGRGATNAGKLAIERDGSTIGQCSFTAGVRDAIAIDGLETAMRPGDNRLGLRLSGGNRMPYLLAIAYHALGPENDGACPLRLRAKLCEPKVRRGHSVGLAAELANRTAAVQPMSVAVLGLPAGLEARREQLDGLKAAGTIDGYEVRRREVYLYWRTLAPKRTIEVKLDLTAAVPGKYVGPPSRAYLYDSPESARWLEPLEVEIRDD